MLAAAVHRLALRLAARRALGRLRRGGPPPLLGALEAFVEDGDPALARWAPRVEALRAALDGRADSVAFVDYGAGGRLQPTDGTAPTAVTRSVAAINRGSAPPHEGRLLFHLVRALRPSVALELGTCLGLSAAYQAAALAENGAGRLVTLEGGAALADHARRHLDALELTAEVEVVTGPFAETLPDVLLRLAPVDYVFLDGHHDPVATARYVDVLLPHLARPALLVLDDIAWSVGMRRAWRALVAHPEVTAHADLLVIGLAWVGR